MVHSKRNSEAAVSPVIAILLMLVVTLIIAAVVSGFAGGLIQTEKKTPQASITAKYSQYNGLTMTHAGGDTLAIKDIYVVMRPTEEFGHGQDEHGTKYVNMSTISDVEGNYWIDQSDATYGVMSWRPGDSMFVKGGTDLAYSGLMVSSTDWPPCYNDKIQGGQGTENGLSRRCFVTSINNQINIGKTINIEVSQKDGKLISSSRCVIEP